MEKETIINTSRKEVVQAVKILIEMLDEMVYKNPDLDVEVFIDDGRKFRLKFERTDLDFKNEKRSVSDENKKQTVTWKIDKQNPKIS